MLDTANLELAGRSPKVAISVSAKKSGLDPQSLGRVLIVEDEVLVAWHLESVLEHLQIEVADIVSNGADALEAVASGDVGLIFMDVNLNGSSDGIAVARHINEIRRTPIIFVTAYTDELTLARIKSHLPFSPVVSKPATAATVRSAIRQISAEQK